MCECLYEVVCDWQCERGKNEKKFLRGDRGLLVDGVFIQFFLSHLHDIVFDFTIVMWPKVYVSIS